MIFDLHIHEKKNSADSILDIYEAIDEAKLKGLDGICITDHDSLGLRNKIKKFDKLGIKVIIGVEIYTLDGDLLCFGIEKIPENSLTAQETIDFVKKQGGVCIAAHPFRDNNRGIGSKIRNLKGLDAIEVLNGRTKKMGNKLAYELARELNLPMTGGSDAHKSGEVGKCVTKFKSNIKTEEDFVKAIKNGEMYISINDYEKIKIS